jgi:hypothetical protein
MQRLGRRFYVAALPSGQDLRPQVPTVRVISVVVTGVFGAALALWACGSIAIGLFWYPRFPLMHFQSLSLLPMAVGLLFWSACTLLWVADHFDHRPNEATYRALYRVTFYNGSFLVLVGLAMSLLAALADPIASSDTSGTGRHIFHPAVANTIRPVVRLLEINWWWIAIVALLSGVVVVLRQRNDREPGQLSLALFSCSATALMLLLCGDMYLNGTQQLLFGEWAELSWLSAFILAMGMLTVVLGVAAVVSTAALVFPALAATTPAAAPGFDGLDRAGQIDLEAIAPRSVQFIAPVLVVALGATAVWTLGDVLLSLRSNAEDSNFGLKLMGVTLILAAVSASIAQGLRRGTYLGWHSLLLLAGILVLVLSLLTPQAVAVKNLIFMAALVIFVYVMHAGSRVMAFVLAVGFGAVLLYLTRHT